MIAVSSAATSTDLTTLEAVKDDLSITTADEDSYIVRAIARVTGLICNHLRVAQATDCTATLGRETLVETFRLKHRRETLVLSRFIPRDWPMEITSIVEGDAALTVDDYEFDGSSGLLRRLSGGARSWWSAATITVTHQAGWFLPGDAGRDLPQVIEDAAIGLVKLARVNRTRDPTLRQENILENLYSYQLFAPSDNPGGMPDDVAAMLEPYVNRFTI